MVAKNDWLIDWLIIYGFTSRSRIFHLYGDVTIAGEGLQNLGLCSALRTLEQGDLFRATPAVTRGLGFSGLIRSTAAFCRLLRHTRGCGGFIPTRILTGSHSVTSYDKQGDAEDLFLPGSSQVRKIWSYYMKNTITSISRFYLAVWPSFKSSPNLHLVFPTNISQPLHPNYLTTNQLCSA
jgi:hypothetical protein